MKTRLSAVLLKAEMLVVYLTHGKNDNKKTLSKMPLLTVPLNPRFKLATYAMYKAFRQADMHTNTRLEATGIRLSARGTWLTG